MPDIRIVQGQSVPETMRTKYVEQTDGTHALVVSLGGPSDPGDVRDTWRVSRLEDGALNDSDKTFAVPATTEWQILHIWVSYAAGAVVGNRQVEVIARDADGDTLGRIQAGLVQAASTTYGYNFAPGLPDLTALRDTNFLQTPIPPTWILGPSFSLRIFDNKAISAALDDMTVRILLAARSIA